MGLPENIFLLDLNNDWKQVRPSVKELSNKFIITGYQSYELSDSGIVPLSDNVKLKFDLVKRNIQSDCYDSTVSDIGCANMFFGFLANFYKAKRVIGVDLDIDYLNQNNYLINHFSMKNVTCKSINVVDFKEKSDVVIAFAIIHWIYSCTGFLGSLENVVNHLHKLTNKCLYVEWIDPSDDCISQMLHHIDFNKGFTIKDYNKVNFLKYLNDIFSSVEFLGNSKSTREIYRCLV